MDGLRRRMILFAAALAMLATAAMAAQSLDSAKAFLAGLYAGYQHGGEPDSLGPRAGKIFTPRLLTLIRLDEARAKGEVGILDGDPICDCQDPGGLKVQSLAVAAAGAGHARAKVAISLDGDVRRLTFDLEEHGQGWRIADVHSKDTPSLVGLLEGGLKQEAKAAHR
jgi:hypothetical protein